VTAASPGRPRGFAEEQAALHRVATLVARARRRRTCSPRSPTRPDFSRGSGLTGLRDRVEAFGGRISLRSPAGGGTALEITLPLDGPAGVVGR
jgi:signal transduction histidine kinase